MKVNWAAVARLSVFFVCALSLQWYRGAYKSETSGDADEPAHIVTGLMVREYVTHGLGESPMNFARRYYLHYPKVGLGHWPPVFYIEQTVWTLLFPATRSSLLVMIALFAAIMTALTYPIVQEKAGTFVAWCISLVLISAPGVALNTSQVMTEIPLAISTVAAMVFYGRYLDSGDVRYSVLFGISAAASLLTKGSALVLSVVPILGVLLTRRWDLLRRRSFWLPALLVIGICAPWYLFAPGALHQRAVPLGGPGLITRRWALPPGVWAANFDFFLASLALIGLVWVVFQAVQRRPVEGVWASAAAVVIAATVFPMLFAVWEPRHQVEGAAAFAILATAGLSWMMDASPKVCGLVIGFFTLLTLVSGILRVQEQAPPRYGTIASAIVHGDFGSAKAILICADAIGEGVLISEVAQREHMPVRYLLRGTKILADVSWLGISLRERFSSSEEIGLYLSSLPVDLVILDQLHPSKLPYAALLASALEGRPGEWQRVPSDAAGQLTVYRRSLDAHQSQEQIDTLLTKALSGITP
jgi:hypothetical protein